MNSPLTSLALRNAGILIVAGSLVLAGCSDNHKKDAEKSKNQTAKVTQEKEDVEKKLDDANRKIEKLNSLNKKLGEVEKNLAETNGTLQNENNNFAKRTKDLEGEVARLNGHNSDLNKRNQWLESTNGQLETSNSSLKAENKALSDSNADLTFAATTVEVQRKQNEETLANIAERENTLSEMISSAEEATAAAEQAAAATEAKIAQNNQLIAEKEELLSKIQGQNEEAETLAAEIAATQSANEELVAEIEAMNAAHATAVAEFNQAVADERAAIVAEETASMERIRVAAEAAGSSIWYSPALRLYNTAMETPDVPVNMLVKIKAAKVNDMDLISYLVETIQDMNQKKASYQNIANNSISGPGMFRDGSGEAVFLVSVKPVEMYDFYKKIMDESNSVEATFNGETKTFDTQHIILSARLVDEVRVKTQLTVGYTKSSPEFWDVTSVVKSDLMSIQDLDLSQISDLLFVDANGNQTVACHVVDTRCISEMKNANMLSAPIEMYIEEAMTEFPEFAASQGWTSDSLSADFEPETQTVSFTVQEKLAFEAKSAHNYYHSQIFGTGEAAAQNENVLVVNPRDLDEAISARGSQMPNVAKYLAISVELELFDTTLEGLRNQEIDAIPLTGGDSSKNYFIRPEDSAVASTDGKRTFWQQISTILEN